MSKGNELSNEAAQRELVITRIFNAPRQLVWKAWTEPGHFKKWWGPKEYTCPYCSIDLKVGGKYLASMQSEDGKKIWSTGTYREIKPQRKIVYTDSFADSKGNIVPGSDYNMPEMPMELIVTIEFEEADGKSNMSLHHAGLPVAMADDCIKGWQSSFDKLESNFK
jgi:uncharacterized protein YndB with AHSA1/START domain